MQSSKRFNSPLKRRTLFAEQTKQLPIRIRQGDTIIQGVPIEITCNEYLDDSIMGPSGANLPNGIGASYELNPGSSFIFMNNEEDQKMR